MRKIRKSCSLKDVFDKLYTFEEGDPEEVTETLSFDDPDIERGVECPSTLFLPLVAHYNYYYYYYYIRKKGLHFECGGTCSDEQINHPDSKGRPTLPTFSETQKALRLFGGGNWLTITPIDNYYITDIVIETCDNTSLESDYYKFSNYIEEEENNSYWWTSLFKTSKYINEHKVELSLFENEDRYTGVKGTLKLLCSGSYRCSQYKSLLIKSLTITLKYQGTPEPYMFYDSSINNLYPLTDILEEEVTGEYNDTYLNELFKRIYLLFADWSIFSYTIYEGDDDTLRQDWDKWLSTFLGVFVLTRERYETLLEVYEKEQDSLLNQLKTSRSISNKSGSETRVNDTPQVQDDGTIEGDDYITQYQRGNQSQRQKEVSSFDPMTAMARLTEIGNQYRKVWSDWVDEFRTLFYPKNKDKVEVIDD